MPYSCTFHLYGGDKNDVWRKPGTVYYNLHLSDWRESKHEMDLNYETLTISYQDMTEVAQVQVQHSVAMYTMQWKNVLSINPVR